MAATSDLVRRLASSRFNYWFGYVANGGWVAWLVAQGSPWGTQPMPARAFWGHALAGALLWSLLEYVLHRYVYHQWPSALSHGHGLHHHAPKELIGVPWWLTSLAIFALYKGLGRWLPAGPLGVEMGCCWLGYIGYCLVHHASHHWPMRRGPLRALKRRHQAHHAFPDRNWGVTSPVWDLVFGTYRAGKAVGRSPSARARSIPPQ